MENLQKLLAMADELSIDFNRVRISRHLYVAVRKADITVVCKPDMATTGVEDASALLDITCGHVINMLAQYERENQ